MNFIDFTHLHDFYGLHGSLGAQEQDRQVTMQSFRERAAHTCLLQSASFQSPAAGAYAAAAGLGKKAILPFADLSKKK